VLESPSVLVLLSPVEVLEVLVVLALVVGVAVLEPLDVLVLVPSPVSGSCAEVSLVGGEQARTRAIRRSGRGTSPQHTPRRPA